MENKFRVIFTGDIKPEYTIEQVKVNIAKLYKVPINNNTSDSFELNT